MIGLVLLGGIIIAGIYVCIIVNKSKQQCHKHGCKKCGRCHRMREDSEK